MAFVAFLLAAPVADACTWTRVPTNERLVLQPPSGPETIIPMEQPLRSGGTCGFIGAWDLEGGAFAWMDGNDLHAKDLGSQRTARFAVGASHIYNVAWIDPSHLAVQGSLGVVIVDIWNGTSTPIDLPNVWRGHGQGRGLFIVGYPVQTLELRSLADGSLVASTSMERLGVPENHSVEDANDRWIVAWETGIGSMDLFAYPLHGGPRRPLRADAMLDGDIAWLLEENWTAVTPLDLRSGQTGQAQPRSGGLLLGIREGVQVSYREEPGPVFAPSREPPPGLSSAPGTDGTSGTPASRPAPALHVLALGLVAFGCARMKRGLTVGKDLSAGKDP